MMKMRFKFALLISILTTLLALISVFIAMPDSAGYEGLFFIALSPVIVAVFILWTYVLVYVRNKNKIAGSFGILLLLTVAFQYLVLIVTIWGMSSDLPDYNLKEFISDARDIFAETNIFYFVLAIALCYTFLLRRIERYILPKKK